MTKKRKSLSTLTSSTPKTPRVEASVEVGTPDSGLRRSGRSRVNVVYSDAGLESASASRASSARGTPSSKRGGGFVQGDDESGSGDELDGRQRMAAKLGVRTQNPYVQMVPISSKRYMGKVLRS